RHKVYRFFERRSDGSFSLLHDLLAGTIRLRPARGGLRPGIGLLWLGKKAGWFPPEFTEMIRPIVLVAAGVLLVALALLTNKAGDRKGV
ncbi:MAG TPA: hypothetical protein P5208_00635, partial [Smithellaceae bacterium]|nr:hypothetical protein [Smithellaceae bacterium]